MDQPAFDWQTWVALAIVALAAGWLVKRCWFAMRTDGVSPSCGDCCHKSDWGVRQKQLIQIDLPGRSPQD